jgi:hypothetical protein
MADATTVNTQITDAVTQTNVKVLGESPAQALAVLYQNMAHSLSLSMQNASSAQNQMQQIGAAVVSAACSNIMAGK